MMMFDLLEKLYTEKTSAWINDVDNSTISPIIINKFLMMNSSLSAHTMFLDEFTFNLAPKHWLVLAWSILPKYSRAPFYKYIKRKNDTDALSPVWRKIQKSLNSSDNDMIYIKKYFKPILEKDKSKWFRMMGMPKTVWTDNGLNYDDIRGTEGVTQGKGGLELFGL